MAVQEHTNYAQDPPGDAMPHELAVSPAARTSRGLQSSAPLGLPVRALLIKQEVLGQILNGTRTIDIRNQHHRFAGQTIYLMECKSGVVKATATLGAPRNLTLQERQQHAEELAKPKYTRPQAWPLSNVQLVREPWCVLGERRRRLATWVPQDRWGSVVGLEDGGHIGGEADSEAQEADEPPCCPRRQ